MRIQNTANGHEYVVDGPVARAEKYNLYLCRSTGTDTTYLLQVAKEKSDNVALDRMNYYLGELASRAQALEEEYAQIKSDPKIFLNYNAGFPKIEDSFICESQGRRRINILSFVGIDQISNLVPLANLSKKDHLRVDLKTSAWIIGKLLKMIAFFHSSGLAISQLDGNNILIEPNSHNVLLFDWSETVPYDTEVPANVRKKEIAQAASSVLIALGREKSSGEIPDDGEEYFSDYIDFILRLNLGKESCANKAHEDFYTMIRENFGWKGFHPFTTRKTK